MARIRTIKPDFFADESLASCSAHARLLAIALLQMADREGRMRWIPMQVHAHAFPHEPELDIVSTAMELEQIGFLERYEIEGKRLAWIPGFLRHQLPSRDEPESQLPAVNGGLTGYLRPPNPTERMRIYQRDRFRCVYCGTDMSSESRKRCLDHVIPYSRGGSNSPNNLVTSCKKCNAIKANRDPDEAGMRWPEGRGETNDETTVNDTLTGGKRGVTDPSLGRGQGKGTGNREREQGKKIDSPEPEIQEPPAITFTLNTGAEHPVTRQQLDEFASLYPGIDVMQELRKLKGWCSSNPTKRKTKRGASAFVNSWLSRAQDECTKHRGNGNGQRTEQPRRETATAAVIRRSVEGFGDDPLGPDHPSVIDADPWADRR